MNNKRIPENIIRPERQVFQALRFCVNTYLVLRKYAFLIRFEFVMIEWSLY